MFLPIAAFRDKAVKAEWLDTLSHHAGIGLWDAILYQGDAMHPRARWTWSAEFRRLCGFTTEAEFPNVVQSWSDRLHPDDAGPTFAAFSTALKTGQNYDTAYRLKVKDGSYRWFRATGGVLLDAQRQPRRACGSLVDIHAARMSEQQHRADSEREAVRTSAAAAQQAAVVTGLAGGLARLAKGDLTCRVDIAFAPEYDILRTDFNAAVSHLETVVRQIVANTGALRSGTNEITRAADDLSRRTEQQAASLEETAAALDEITATVRKTAEGTNRAQTVMTETKAAAEQSGELVRDAVSAMSEIEASAGQISQIIGVIDEIAFQTNLLALNAGVEAARAGDAGRGFAVVASEVRALAQRSAEAAKEIKSLIQASSQQVSRGVKLVGDTGQSLGRILSQVGQVYTAIIEIAASAQEQATGLHQVNTAVNQMDQVTQQNAAMVEQSTAASHGLAQETEALTSLTGQFQVSTAAKGETAPSRVESLHNRQTRSQPGKLPRTRT
jgi:methyl-accepting chemotaxis protein